LVEKIRDAEAVVSDHIPFSFNYLYLGPGFKISLYNVLNETQ
jgi:hypothetical protein